MKIDLQFYDNDEEDLVEENYPDIHTAIVNLNGQTDVPYQDFLATCLLKDHTDRAGFGLDYDTIRDNVHSYWGINDAFFRYDAQQGLFNSILPDNNNNHARSELVGIGISLTVAGKIFNLTPADWTRIADGQQHSMDFAATDGIRIIQCEAKGNISDNNILINPSITQRYNSIKEKKVSLRDVAANNRNIYLGIIGAVDTANFPIARIVDPEPEANEIDPQKFKLLNRLNYYYDFIKLISPRSHIAITLRNRIEVIKKVASDFQLLNEIKLLNSVGKPIPLPTFHSSGFQSIGEKAFFGKTFILDDENSIFVGISLAALKIIVNQDFDQIAEFRESPFTREMPNLKVRFGRHDDFIQPYIRNQSIKVDNKGFFNNSISADIYSTSAGILFSLLKTQTVLTT